MRDLIALVAQVGDQKAARKLMPWAMKNPAAGATASAEEVAHAEAELEAGIVFAD